MPEPIQIVIKRADVSQEAQTAQQAQAENEPGRISFQQNAVNAMVVNYSKQIMNESIKIYSALKGDQRIANIATNITTLASDIATIAKGGWVGVAAVAVNKGMKAVEMFTDYEINMQHTAYLLDLTGGLSINSSRGFIW